MLTKHFEKIFMKIERLCTVLPYPLPHFKNLFSKMVKIFLIKLFEKYPLYGTLLSCVPVQVAKINLLVTAIISCVLSLKARQA